MRRMGGLAKKIPWTYWTMLAATLAITGAPGFSGFFSKDEILFRAAVSQNGGVYLWAIGLAAALLTSFYMFRLLFLTFHGAPRFDEHATHVHESPKNMLVPLVILAVLATVGGWFAAPAFWGGVNHFDHYLDPVFATASEHSATAAPATAVWDTIGAGFASLSEEAAHRAEMAFAGISVAIALVGFLFAWWLYIRSPDKPERMAERLRAPYMLLLNKYYVDELYAAVIVRPLVWLSTRVLWRTVDEGLIDGTVNGVAGTARAAGAELRQMQSGNARSYATWIVIGAVAVTGFLLWMVH